MTARTEHNAFWAPIEPPKPPIDELVRRYRAAPPVRLSRTQRYSLVLLEPCPEPVWIPQWIPQPKRGTAR